MAGFLIGVDVGTGSARAGVFDRDGTLLAHAKRDIVIFRDDRGHVEQSSTQVWQAVARLSQKQWPAQTISVSGGADSHACDVAHRAALPAVRGRCLRGARSSLSRIPEPAEGRARNTSRCGNSIKLRLAVGNVFEFFGGDDHAV
jgi:D-ribulokinase